MDVTPEMASLLACSECAAPLSCGPVLLTMQGDATCGRCEPPREPFVRSTHYELIARILRFPCRFAEEGCEQTLAFSDTPHRHEEVCEYQTLNCPESKFKVCDWTGQLTQLYDHYNLNHRDKILENPCTLPLTITQSSVDIFLLLAYKVLFLIHTKVCFISKKILISIQFLGDTEMVSTYKYTLDFLKHEFVISKPGSIISKNTEPLEENSCLSTSMNSLLEVMGDIDGIKINITVKHVNETGIHPISPNHLKCANWCFDSEINKFESRHCRNESRGCTYMDINKKCEKHERYFCTLNQQCSICTEDIPSTTTLEEHWAAQHEDVMHHTGELWSARLLDWQVQYCVLTCAALQRAVLCRYKLCWAQFSVALLTPLRSEELKTLRCAMRVSHPVTDHMETYEPDVVLDEVHDWTVALPLETKGVTELKIQIDIVELDLDNNDIVP